MNDEEYYNFVRPYADAMQMLLTRLDVLNHNLYGKSDSRPIHYIQNRIKKKKSLEEKLIRRGKEPTVDNAKDYLQDIAGVRIICYFVDDIYNLAKSLKRQADLIVIREQDYIKAPKPNGYRSYHLIVGVPVYCMDGMEYFPVEVQLRTLSMDFWASMEHRISYKKERADKEELTTVVGLEMMRSVNEENAEETRKVQIVKSAISTLSFSELEAIIHIFDEMDGKEGILVASKIADRVGITRSVIVNALRKFESAGVIESRSSGMKGTYIKVLNDVVFDELDKIKKQNQKK